MAFHGREKAARIAADQKFIILLFVVLFYLLTFTAPAFALGKKRPEASGGVSPVEVASSGSPPISFQLRVLTYNIQGLPLPHIDHTKYEKIGRILGQRKARGNAPQIVAIQEAFHSDSRNIPRFARYPWAAFGPRAKPMGINSGLLLLSQYRMAAYDEVRYVDCAGTDCFAAKGIQRATLSIPTGRGINVELEVFNTHMNADDDVVSNNNQSRKARLGQIRQYGGDFLRRSRVGELPALFLGDYNFQLGRPDYNLFASLVGGENAVETCTRARNCTGDQDMQVVLEQTVDHHFYLAGYAAGRPVSLTPVHAEEVFDEAAPGERLSDHTGIEVVYQVTVH
ncbi:MAG: endonuclease/exonuclease/phosphatase family protein [Bdellovibrionota bacterium]